jgi:hypothetical protein
MTVASVSVKGRCGTRVTDAEVPPIKNQHLSVADVSVGGDAPKDVLHVYNYKSGEIRKDKPSTWPVYIAKVGHKVYPSESITEQIMTDVGKTFGFRMADSCLRKVSGQVRFLSRHFLKKNEQLVHGLSIFASYLEDEEFVQSVREERRSKDVFDFDTIINAIKSVFSRYPGACEDICRDYVRMLAYDAITGNNDRHHANWGVIEHVKGSHPPAFSPIYDSARGLFWNYLNDTLRKRYSRSHETKAFVTSYIDGATPMTSFSGQGEVNHFDLVTAILRDHDEYEEVLEDHYRPSALSTLREILEDDYSGLLTEPRRELILDCLERRLELYRQAISGG